ncbi:conserved hypothetical protein [Paecilomyces variotii No. 5]|uniref:AB hydrolase-1 domain-containing protein n=1 Tax=Byssochlamys spectabilis (strain No. 5 / NBRC 109023) TaxID=1356009 RepID=V5FV14_BYSSN|nr:conserved hypothetical protein [Paecilomyces variotii No. 5]
MAPGLLYVTMQPRDGLPDAQFHDWYNNEHGPLRLRLPFIQNGFRYRATDLNGSGKGLPEWVALYDVIDMTELTRAPYTTLREPGVKSERERETMANIAVDRRLYDLLDDQHAENFRPLEELNAPVEGSVLVALSTTVQPGKEAELDRWYREEHIPLLTKVPGWLRTRRFASSNIEKHDEVEYLTLHEYAANNGLGGPEWQAATSTPWTKEINTNVVKDKHRRAYSWYYTFGPAPRELGALNSGSAPFVSPDGKTKTFPASNGGRAAVESYMTTRDGVDITYRLEGAGEPDAPLLVLSNSILVEWGIWDYFLDAFFQQPQNRRYRVLRYHTRGRLEQCGERPVTVDVLAEDLVTLLDALRVPQAAAAIGVSLGGATVLNTALQYPERVAGFVSCDTNSVSPSGNRKAWGDRAAIAIKEGAVNEEGEAIVGQELAEATVRRWFVPASYDNGPLQGRVERVREMIRGNSLKGFQHSVHALFEYDMRAAMKTSGVRGIFVVGGGDGVLPQTMKEMASSHGQPSALHVLEGAGHLPMVEKPEEFAEVVTRFLEGY